MREVVDLSSPTERGDEASSLADCICVQQGVLSPLSVTACYMFPDLGERVSNVCGKFLYTVQKKCRFQLLSQMQNHRRNLPLGVAFSLMCYTLFISTP